jgi:methylenetetrahydrofolate dehydrogenase (NADP+)/methenyltetrahydrofolate cyclohydrolase
MAAHIIDGKALAADLRATVARDVTKLVAQGLKPGLAVVLVGNDPASEVYVRSKAKQTLEAGMASFEHRLSTDVTEAALLALVASLNDDDAVDGILLQLPLPPQIDAEKVLRAIDPGKDVDGFHPTNVGLVATGTRGIVPCTPLGSMMLLKSVCSELAGFERRHRWAFEHRGKADVPTAAQGKLPGHHGTFKEPRPTGTRANG